MRLQIKSVSPEPDTRLSALSPQSAIWVLPDGLVVRKVWLVLWIGEICLVNGALAAKIGDPERTKEADADCDEAQRQQQRPGDKQTVGTAHLGQFNVTAGSPRSVYEQTCCSAMLRQGGVDSRHGPVLNCSTVRELATSDLPVYLSCY